MRIISAIMNFYWSHAIPLQKLSHERSYKFSLAGFLKVKFHDHFFWRKAQNLRAENVLGMRIEILIFATKKIALRQWVELFSTHWRNKKRNQSNSSIFTKNRWHRSLCIFQNQNKMEIQNTLFGVECTWAEIIRRAKVAREKFALKICRGICP